MKIFLITALLLINFQAIGYQKIELEIPSGTTLSITQFEAEGKKLLIWLPSEHGFSPQLISTALDVNLHDIDVWAANLHETYMVPVGRQSLNEVEVGDLVSLVRRAHQIGFQEVYFLSSGRGAQLALKTAYLWQQKNPDNNLIKGMMFFSPHLIKGRTEIGEKAEFVEISKLSNLPIYIFQEQYSTKYARIKEISQQLQQGGSPTYIELLKGIRGGFYMRPDEDLTLQDIEMRNQLPAKLARAVRLLSRTSVSSILSTEYSFENNSQPQKSTYRTPQLYDYKGVKNHINLDLPVMGGSRFKLSDYQDKVVLINFWATWCTPCVEEIPSLSRLQSKMTGKPFKIVAINIGEPEAVIEDFLKKVPVDFDILLDSDGSAVRNWKVYAYPSNFIIDKSGVIQYAYRGALEWDAEPVVQKINGLLN